jgi:hypothetical protein
MRSPVGELRLMTTLAYFGTAVDITVAELRMEAFLSGRRGNGVAARGARGDRLTPRAS